MLAAMVSDSIMQLLFKKLPLVEFSGSIKEEYPQLYEKDLKMQLQIYEMGFSS